MPNQQCRSNEGRLLIFTACLSTPCTSSLQRLGCAHNRSYQRQVFKGRKLSYRFQGTFNYCWMMPIFQLLELQYFSITQLGKKWSKLCADMLKWVFSGAQEQFPNTPMTFTGKRSHAGSGVVRIDLLHFLARCRKRCLSCLLA